MEDFFVEDVLELAKATKKRNSKNKGSRGERDLCKIFNSRFEDILSMNPSWGKFSRSVGSGSRWSQTNLGTKGNEFYSGDIICDHFKFTIESKNGYDIDMFSAFEGNKQLSSFLLQAKKDSERCNKKPLLIWRKTRYKPLVFMENFEGSEKFPYRMFYENWLVLSLTSLLTMPDDFFFNQPLHKDD